MNGQSNQNHSAGPSPVCSPEPRAADTALELLREHGHAVDAYLRGLRNRYPAAPKQLLDSIDYSLLAGGKRLRPTLVLECARAVGGALPNASALAAAGALELIHCFSLVHDDLPAMDNDDLRRGRPTNHKVFGEAMAILTGDAMVTMAFEVLAADSNPSLVGRLISELAGATGPLGMIGGQVLDMDGENKSLALSELQQLHRMKTGALLTASCRLGAIAAGASDAALDAVTRYGQRLGLAFQIVDDILDVTSTPEQMGKATNKDQAKGKNTYPTMMGLEKSRQMAREQLDAALDAIGALGRPAAGLCALGRFIVERNV